MQENTQPPEAPHKAPAGEPLHTPISRGLRALSGVDGLTYAEPRALVLITYWAGKGLMLENHTAKGAGLLQDAEWLHGKLKERAIARRLERRRARA